MSKNFIAIQSLFWAIALLLSCHSGGREEESRVETETADSSAYTSLQGVWINKDTDSPLFMIRRDSVFYPDSTSMAQRIRVQDDTLYLGSESYLIEQLGDYNLAFETLTGETIHARKSTAREDSLVFMLTHKTPVIYTEVTKRDTVTTYEGKRHHCYITINPSSNKVYRTGYTDEGVAIQNFYYDNVIHLSVYEGKNRIYGSNFTKDIFSTLIPEQFLEQATLSDIRFNHTDKNGFHFDATVCIPEGAACYMIDVVISSDGEVSYQLMDF